MISTLYTQNNIDILKDINQLNKEYIINTIYSDIPEFLQNSELYMNMESNDNFDILKKYYKNNLKIDSIEDFYHILHTLRFWSIVDIPFEIYDYIIFNKKKY